MLRSLYGSVITKAAAYVVLATGIVLSLLAFWYVDGEVKEKERLRFETLTKQAAILVKGRMDAYRQILYAGSGLFESSESVEREEWRTFVDALRIDENFPGIQGLGYSEVVPPQEKERHTARVRAEGFPDYAIRPGGERELYTSIIYLEPFNTRNRRAFGYDMFSEKVRREAMMRSALSGQAATSGKVRLVQENNVNEQAGFLMYVPVYRKGMALRTPKERMAALRGFVYAPFRADDLMYGVLGNRYADVALDIYDGKEKDPRNLLLVRKTLDTRGSTISLETQLDIDGRIWTLQFRPLSGFINEAKTHDAWFALLLGLLVSLTLFWVILSLVRVKEKAQEIAREMTEELSHAKEQFELAIQGSSDGIWDWDVRTNAVFYSKRWKTMLGYADDELPNVFETFASLIYEEDRERVEAYLKRYFNGEFDTYSIELRMKHKDGSLRWILARGEALRTPDGRPYRMTGSHTDITDRKLAEEELQKASHLNKVLLDNSAVGIFLGSSERTILSVNQKLCDIFGYERDEMIGKNLRMLHLSDEAYETFGAQYRRLLENGKTELEYRYARKDGTPIWCSVSGTPLDKDDLSRGIIWTIIDITEQVRITAELQEAKLKAESASIAKSRFLANMSHEIRTPMNALIGLSELLLDTPLDAKQHDYLEKIRSSSKMLLAIINDILDYSKIEAGKLELEYKTLDLENVLSQLRVIFTQTALKQGLELYFYMKNDVPGVIMGDELRLDQVLSNLLSNALKFTHAGHIALTIELKERLGDDRALLSFSVSDTGIGMNDEQLSRLFRPFTQADSSTTRRYGGTGLGLTISQKLLNAMGAELRVESQKGVGTTFGFDLEAEVVTWHQSHPALQENPCKILIVDDQEISRLILREMIARFGCSADEAAGAEEAIRMIAQAEQEGGNYDFVLMDWQMPGMNGKEAIRHIARMVEEGSLAAKVPSILMVSAYRKEEIGLEEGIVDAFLSKPVTATALFDALSSLKKGVLRPIEAAKSHNLPDLGGIRVLLVEDNEINQEVAMMMLQRVGIRAQSARNGKEGVETFLSDPGGFDLILMDLQMPIMSGYEATTIIREHDRQIPIIALTAAAMVEDRAKVLEAGMNDHLGKPIDSDELYRVIAFWCGTPAPERTSVLQVRNTDAVLDVAFAAEMLGGNEELMEKLFAKLLSQLEGEFADLGDRIARNDPSAAGLVHALKGVSGNLGAMAVAALCTRIDASYKAGEHPSAEDTARLVSAIRELKEALQSGTLIRPPTEVPKPAGEELKRLFAHLFNDLEEGNMIQTEEQKALLRGMEGLVDPGELRSWNDAMDEYDYDKALGIMQQWNV